MSVIRASVIGEVYAYLYRPVAPPAGRKLPVVVFNRGSYVRDDFSYEVLVLANRLAHQGYLVIAPMLRGSGGARGHDEMGGADLRDLMNVVSVIKELPYAEDLLRRRARLSRAINDFLSK